ncbi:hypothetical protein [Brevibacillus brevis]|uniref:hypothetical protein n=1 Tax=Brevibacillus brevis TaxID=1393 RepID=UPI0037C6109F
MAKTYYAEGRQITFLLRVLFVMMAVLLFFYLVPGLHWSIFFLFLIAGVLIAEVMGSMWTGYRRQAASVNKSIVRKITKQSSQKTTTDRGRADARRKLTDAEIMNADIDILSGSDFERLMECYYRENGYLVERIGGPGSRRTA